MKYPVYIPSFGRCGIATTPKVLDKGGVQYLLVVEKDEYQKYKDCYGEGAVLSMPGSGYGSSPAARNFCKDHATKNGHLRHWQLDDNITAIIQNVNGKRGSMSVRKIFETAESFVDQYSNIGIASFAYTTFGFRQKKPFLINKGNASCMLILNNTPYKFNENIIEDTDFTLQHLKNKLCTIVFYAFLQNKMPPEKMKGGNTDTIHNMPTRMKRIRGMIAKYPEIKCAKVAFGKPRVSASGIWRQFDHGLVRRSEP